ncbi:outer membrane beta-barrel protein [candidate division GN15 bacterium]|nr:outer membrane beta-barrel protein [candidate division GN15 bacterium]
MRGSVSLLIVLFLAAPAVAQQSPVGLEIGGGLDGALGETGESANFGVHGSLSLRVKPAPISSKELDLFASIDYVAFSASRSTNPDLRFILAGFEARLRLLSGQPSGLYVIGGGGYAHTTRKAFDRERPVAAGTTLVRTVPERTENNLFMTAGIGLIVTGNPSRFLFVEARLTNIFGTAVKNYTFVPLTVGISF